MSTAATPSPNRILRDHNRAQDATQQALLGAWRDLPNLRDTERFDAWLRRLVVNACYVEARGQRRFLARMRVLPVDCMNRSIDPLFDSRIAAWLEEDPNTAPD